VARSDIQSSFSAGELSKSLYGRVDLDKYQSGAALMENFFVDYRGGASSRPGTQLIDRARQPGSAAPPHLFPFIFSQGQSYVLELGDLYMRFYTNGQQLLQTGVAITGITQANPAVVTSVAHGFATGKNVYLSGVGGMTQVNGVTYQIVVIDANHYSLQTLDGVGVNSIFYTPYISGGTGAGIYELVTPWAAVDLPKLKWAQSADVITFTHNSYPIYNLSRTGVSTFTLALEVIAPVLPAVTGATAFASVAGNLIYQYIVCPVTRAGVRGAQNNSFAVGSKALDPLAATPVVIECDWAGGGAADHFDVFKTGPVPNTATNQPTVFGYIGSTVIGSFNDNNIGPNYADNPPDFRNPFSGGKNPGCVAYIQQRRVYANIANSSPEQMEFSVPGAYSVFDTTFTVNASDALSISLTSRQENGIVSLVPTSTGLVVFTTGGAFLVSGGSPSAALTPTTITALPQASAGANDLRPLQINYDILYVEAKGSTVRDLSFNFYTQSFYGFDRSALANHLFFGYTLVDWDYAEAPFKMVWAVRNDGRALSLTFMPEQEVYGWAHHYTQGAFNSVCVVPEGNENRVYFVCQRQFGTKKVYYVERMASRKFTRVEDAWCVDCALALPLTAPAYALAMTATPTEATITANSGAPFNSTWLGQIIWLDVGGKLQVDQIISTTKITATILEPLGNRIPDDPLNCFDVPSGLWQVGTPTTAIGGLQHLAGMTVTGLADGMVIDPTVVTSDGTITLANAATKVTVGLGFAARLQTLYLDTGEPTIQGRRKRIPAVTLRVDQTRGLTAGATFDTLTPVKQSGPGAYSVPPPLLSADLYHVIAGGWDLYGQVCVEQALPLPASVLGIIGEYQIGDDSRS
jgi:hypothetical protein